MSVFQNYQSAVEGPGRDAARWRSGPRLRYMVLGLAWVLPGLLSSGCGYRPAFGSCELRLWSSECHPAPLRADADLRAQVYGAADALLRQTAGWPLLSHQALLSTLVVPVDDLGQSTVLGRLVAEQMAERLNQRGYSVVLRPQRWDSLAEAEGTLAALADASGVEVAATGTYAVGQNTVYLNLQLVRLGDGLVLASHGFELPLGANLRALLREI